MKRTTSESEFISLYRAKIREKKKKNWDCVLYLKNLWPQESLFSGSNLKRYQPNWFFFWWGGVWLLRPIICITKRQQQTTTIINKPLYNIHELEEDIMKWLHYYYYYAFSTINKILAVNDGHSFSANKCNLIILLVFFFSNITNIVMLSQLGFFLCFHLYP